MFERFTEDARAVVIAARFRAESLQHHAIGTEHLLLGLLAQPGSPAGVLLVGHGLTLERATATVQQLRSPGGNGGGTGSGTDDDLDAEALRVIGIDLDAVRASVEASFGEGALAGPGGAEPRRRRRGLGGSLPFSPRAKKALELGLREAIRLRQKEIRDLHLLLGLLREGQGLACLVLHRSGIDALTLRQEIEAQLRQAG